MSTLIVFGAGWKRGRCSEDICPEANALHSLVGGLPMLSGRVTGLRMSTI